MEDLPTSTVQAETLHETGCRCLRCCVWRQVQRRPQLLQSTALPVQRLLPGILARRPASRKVTTRHSPPYLSHKVTPRHSPLLTLPLSQGNHYSPYLSHKVTTTHPTSLTIGQFSGRLPLYCCSNPSNRHNQIIISQNTSELSPTGCLSGHGGGGGAENVANRVSFSSHVAFEPDVVSFERDIF